MAGQKKQRTVSKKRTGAVRAVKASGKKTGSSSSGKAKTQRGAKPAAKKAKTAGKPASRKTAVRKKAPVKTKSGARAMAVAPVKAKTEAGRLQELRKMLLGRKEAILREAKEEIAKYISGENRQLVDTALDEGDWAVVDISEDINLMRLASHRKAMHDIDESLRKISEGSYGICEECGEEIGEKRLRVLPTATLCVSCQGNKEKLEAIEKEEPGA
jgi:DnaK suppressor protein